VEDLPYRISIISLGCPKNLVDSEIMLGVLDRAGYEITHIPEEADIIIVNTCAFIDEAKEEAIDTIIQAGQLKEEGNCSKLIVAGCLAQRYKDELLVEMPEIDALVGVSEIEDIAKVIDEALRDGRPTWVKDPTYALDYPLPRYQLTPSHTAYIRIAEGCDNRCSYCVIPDLRGSYRSRPIEDILTEAEKLVKRGAKELDLIAQDTTRYGSDLYGKPSLIELLEKLVGIEDLRWIRILYAYPRYLSSELLEYIASEDKICNYIDIPLQHIDDDILRAMNRPFTLKILEKLIAEIREIIPEVTLRTSLIVGFPGETEVQFKRLSDFVERTRFERLGVFTYSQEEGTPAAQLPGQISDKVKRERKDQIMRLQADISYEINEHLIGKVIPVLVEDLSDDSDFPWVGRSERDAPEIDGLVYIAGDELEIGDIINVRITEADVYDLYGEIAQ